MKRTTFLTVIAGFLMTATVIAAPAQVSAQVQRTNRFTATARFYTVDGCMTTNAIVNVIRKTERLLQGQVRRNDYYWTLVTTYDTCDGWYHSVWGLGLLASGQLDTNSRSKATLAAELPVYHAPTDTWSTVHADIEWKASGATTVEKTSPDGIEVTTYSRDSDVSGTLSHDGYDHVMPAQYVWTTFLTETW